MCMSIIITRNIVLFCVGSVSQCSADVFFFKQKTAYERRISDWSSDVCSSDLRELADAVDRMGRMLTVRRAPRAEFIDISVRSRSPDLAAKIANQYVSTLQETRLMERSKKDRKSTRLNSSH